MLKLRVNGAERTAGETAGRSLLEVLREDLGLNGVKYGCGEGQCRACTVLMEGRAVPSCRIAASAAAGKEIITIEGLSQGAELHPVQQAFLDEDAMQCGYCIPGMILTAVAFLKRTPNPTELQIIDAMNGNLCRCCGYPRILAAVKRAAQPPGGANG